MWLPPLAILSCWIFNEPTTSQLPAAQTPLHPARSVCIALPHILAESSPRVLWVWVTASHTFAGGSIPPMNPGGRPGMGPVSSESQHRPGTGYIGGCTALGNGSSLIRLPCKLKQREVAGIQMNYSNQCSLFLRRDGVPALALLRRAEPLEKSSCAFAFYGNDGPSARSFPPSYGSPSLCLHFHVGWGGGAGPLEPSGCSAARTGRRTRGNPGAPPHRNRLLLTAGVFLPRRLRSLESRGSTSTAASGGPAAH